MHLYYKIFGELMWLGEIVEIHDPSLKRNFRAWVRKHMYEICQAEGYIPVCTKPIIVKGDI